MSKRAYTANRAAANRRYDQKTYINRGLALRIVDDADIIADMQAAQAAGLSKREWLRRVITIGAWRDEEEK